MSEMLRTISFDDISPVFDALSEWCKETKVDPDSLAGSVAASKLLDLFLKGHKTSRDLLAALNLPRVISSRMD